LVTPGELEAMRAQGGHWRVEVTDPVLFLASAAAGFVTGVVMPVDGGYLIQ